MKRTKIFWDSEFTGLHQATTLISLGIVAETGETFYSEFTDFDRNQATPWLQENVIAHLQYITEQNITQLYMSENKGKNTVVCGDRVFIKTELIKWLAQFPMVEFWGDVMAYDWMLLVDLLATYDKGYPKMPENIYYIPFDIATLFVASNVDPDISRKEFGTVEHSYLSEHHALYDAMQIKSCHDKLMFHYLWPRPEVRTKITTVENYGEPIQTEIDRQLLKGSDDKYFSTAEMDEKLAALDKEIREPGISIDEILSLGWETGNGFFYTMKEYNFERPGYVLYYNKKTHVLRIHEAGKETMNGVPLFAGIVYGKDDLENIMDKNKISHDNNIPK